MTGIQKTAARAAVFLHIRNMAVGATLVVALNVSMPEHWDYAEINPICHPERAERVEGSTYQFNPKCSVSA